MRLKTLPLLVMILALLFAGCAPQPAATRVADAAITEAQAAADSQPVELNVFAASSLTEVFGEIGKLFETGHPDVNVVFNFAGSQQLAQQIINGARTDVFASANQKQMDGVVAAGEIVSGTLQTFASNRLVVIYPQDNPAGLRELKDLAKTGLKLVFASQEVPAGQYSLDFLEKATADPAFGETYRDDVLKNVVSYESSVKVVLTKVALGEADAGIVYTSDISNANANQVSRLDIPDGLNVIANYLIAQVKESQQPEIAQAFIDLVLSLQGQTILAKYNFIPVN